MPESDIARIYKREFASAHIIAEHPKCGRLHGHNYTLLVRVYGRSGEWLDFEEIKREVDGLVDGEYDHQDLGDMTCERLARQIQERLINRFRNHVKIELWETGKFGVETL